MIHLKEKLLDKNEEQSICHPAWERFSLTSYQVQADAFDREQGNKLG